MIDFGEVAKAASYALNRNGLESIWLEVTEDGLRVRGALKGQCAERAVAWINLEHYRNGTFALLKKTIDEVSAMMR